MSARLPSAGLLAAPLGAALAGWALGGPGDGAGLIAARVGLAWLVGASLLAPWLGRRGAGSVVGELLSVAAVALVAAGLGLASGLDSTAAGEVGVVALAGLLLPWAWACVPRGLNCPVAARVVFLGGVAAISGTAYLVSPAGGALPTWVVSWNPLARLLGGILGYDWFHGPTLYPRVGEGYYRYPGLTAEIAGPLVTAGLALPVGIALSRLKRPRGGPLSS